MAGNTMKQVIVPAAAPKLDNFTIAEVEKAALKKDSNALLIKVHAASVNPIDWKLAGGFLGAFGPPFPMSPGFDVAGVVVDVSGDVGDFKVGDKVMSDRAAHGKETFAVPAGGAALAEYVTINPKHTTPIPKGWTLNEASTVPLVSLTSLQALRDHAACKAGESVLITSSSGGTGAAAVQLAKILGLHVTAVCSGAKAEFVKGLGADVVIDYKKDKYSEVVAANSIDIVYDTVGGKPEEIAAVLKKGTGRMVTICPMSGEWPADMNRKFLLTDSTRGDQLMEVKGWCEEGKYKTRVEKVFVGLEEAQAAYQYQAAGRVTGKITIEIAKEE